MLMEPDPFLHFVMLSFHGCFQVIFRFIHCTQRKWLHEYLFS